MNYENNILDAIEQIVNNAVEQADYDRTIKATVVECVDQTIGKFKVKHQDSTFFAYATSSEVTYSKNSEVYVLIPGNDTSRDKTILGTVKKLGADYAVNPDGDEAYEIVGNNCIHSSSIFELNSYKDMEVVLYERNSKNNKVSLDTDAIQQYFTKSSNLICGAVFKTQLPTEQQFRGNYGIRFELVFLDNATENKVTRNYVVDVNHMTGNPYKILNETRQYGVFDIDGANFQYVNKISIFSIDFPNKKSNAPNDIFIKNIDFCGAVKLSDSELSGCAITFITPQGIYFDNTDLNSATRELQAQVRVKGKIVDKKSQLLEYYWFVENIGITSMSEHYNKYGGQGWYCLNKSTLVKSSENGNAPIVEWVPGDYKWIVKKSDSAAKKTKYKCVVIYNDNTVISKEIDITNFSSNIDITIESTSGTKFYYDIGCPTLICKINGVEKTSNMTYSWAEVDNNNNFVGLPETSSLNADYNANKLAYDTLQNQIKNETKFAAASKTQLENYKKILDNYSVITRVEKNRIYNVNISEITNFKTFKVSVYSNGIYQGTSSIVLTNSLENEDAYSLVINNGSQVFNYDANGVSPTNEALESPQTLLPLTFTVYDNLGNPIADDIIEKSNIKWIVPKTNTMLKVDNSVYNGYKIAEDENTITYGKLLGISYTISNKYMMKHSNNNIKLIVDYKGMSLASQTDFTFAKDGEPGTNGTEFMIKVVPNTSNNTVPENLMILNGSPNFTPKNSGKWVKVQLWHNGEKIFENTASGTSTENKSVNVTWGILANKYNSSTTDYSTIGINAATGACSYSGFNISNSPANIIKCTVVYDKVEYYGTIPVITAISNSGYGIKLKENSGFKFATYSSDGRSPSYDNSNPFALQVTQTINGYTEDISEMTKNYAVNYNWGVCGRVYSGSWTNVQHLVTAAVKDLKRNQKAFKPSDSYDDESVNNAIYCQVTRSGSTLAQIHIPIHLRLNKYGQAALNKWDGNSIQLDNEGGVILSPQMGAGQKNSDNSFTGVLMGKVKEANKTYYDIGIMGYNKGTRTIFLDSEDGSGTFGKVGNGQIIIDPNNDKAMIYSYNFWKNYTNKGKPSSYGTGNYNGAGLLIDLTTPEIRFGSGNFVVNKDGHITAKGGGTIAGWNIDDDALFTGTKNSASNVQIASKDFTRSINGVSRSGLRIALNNVFAVDNAGTMYAGNAIIGTGTNKITIGKSSANGAYSAIYSGSKTSFNAAAAGFYIGTDGFALGSYDSNKGTSPFQVNNQGQLSSRAGYIAGFAIADNTLSGGTGSNAVGMSSKSGVQWAFWAGNEDAGSAPFHVGHNGALYSTSGQIGGWTINPSTFTGGSMTINSNGSMSGSNWSINTNGYARFTDVYISNGNTSLSATAKMIDIGKFWVTAGGAMHATDGTFTGKISGSSVSGGSVSGASITGGKISVNTNGGGYLRAGTNTTHVDVSGLNVGSAGIAMGGSGISDSGSINMRGGSQITSSGQLTISAGGLKISGGLEVDSLKVTGASTFGSVNFTGGVQVNGTSGVTKEVAVDLAHYATFKFVHGIFVGSY